MAKGFKRGEGPEVKWLVHRGAKKVVNMEILPKGQVGGIVALVDVSLVF